MYKKPNLEFEAKYLSPRSLRPRNDLCNRLGNIGSSTSPRIVGIHILRCFCTFSFAVATPKIKNRRQITQMMTLGLNSPFRCGQEAASYIPASSKAFRAMPRRGSAILEAGLLLPVLIFMTCGAMDFARVFYAGIVVESAARAGVQHGSFGVGNDDSVKMNDAAVSDSSGQGLTGVTASSRTFCSCVGSTTEVSCSTSCSGAIPSGYVETTAAYTFNPIVPYPGVPRNIAISSTAKFRVQ